jgi:hypothetical protein
MQVGQQQQQQGYPLGPPPPGYQQQYYQGYPPYPPPYAMQETRSQGRENPFLHMQYSRCATQPPRRSLADMLGYVSMS